MFRTVIIVGAAIAACAGMANKTAAQVPRDQDAGMTRISYSHNVFVDVDATLENDVQQTKLLTSFYKLVEGQCALVKETIADTCEVTGITASIQMDRNRDYADNRPERRRQLRLNGQVQLLVRLKESVGPATGERAFDPALDARRQRALQRELDLRQRGSPYAITPEGDRF